MSKTLVVERGVGRCSLAGKEFPWKPSACRSLWRQSWADSVGVMSLAHSAEAVRTGLGVITTVGVQKAIHWGCMRLTMIHATDTP